MARNRKSAIALISLFMLLVKFFSDVFKSVKELNGSEKDVYDFFASENGAKKFADLIVIKKTKKVLKTLADLISSLKLDYVNPNITEANFPAQPQDNDDSKKEYKLFDFGKGISSENVIAGMEKDGYRPATTRELLQWAIKNWNGKSLVVALGQTWLDSDGIRGVSVLLFRDGERQLRLSWFGLAWDGVCRFLAIRNRK